MKPCNDICAKHRVGINVSTLLLKDDKLAKNPCV